MTAQLDGAHGAAVRAPVRPWSRIYGFGSVYAKTLRDSRFAFIVAGGLLAGVMLVAGAGVSSVFSTQEARDEIVRLANEVSGLGAGVAGKAVNVGTLGGYLSWKYGPVFLWIAALWSILALSSTLATEARRGSLEFVAAAPFGKRRIAMEKLAAHLTVITLDVAIMAVAAWVAGAAFGKLPGDSIPVQAAVGFALWLELVGLVFGALAFALAQFVGRGAAAGISGGLLIAGYIVNNYAGAIPALAPVADLTPWAWTANHLPLAGQYDWGSLVPLPFIAIALFAVGIEAFARRDLGAAAAVSTPGLPVVTLGLGGPVARAFGERLPVALSWGLGLGAFGLLMASLSRLLADAIATSPDLAATFAKVFPTVDMTSTGGVLQLFVQLLFIVAGFAGATLVAGWASDERTGRLEMLLTTPLARGAWAVRSGVGLLAAVGLMTLVVAVMTGIGAALAGSDGITPAVGMVALGLYAAALAGIGVAVGGVLRTSIAAEIVALLVIATYLIDLLGPPLGLPETFRQLALTSHLGQPMVGVWDWPGVIACLALAAGGLLLGGWGINRRDVAP